MSIGGGVTGNEECVMKYLREKRMKMNIDFTYAFNTISVT
jgi:hypothetical protein